MNRATQEQRNSENPVQADELARLVSERLSKRGTEIVEEWVEWVRSRVDNPTVDALPYRALLNHIPPVVQALTKYLLSPSFAVREEMLGHLKIHGQIRRDQGYEATDVMAEFDGLSHMIFRAMQSEVENFPGDFSRAEMLDVFGRLSDGLRAMSYVTLAVYQQAADDRRHELATRLSDFGRAISHELKNPLNTISLASGFLEEIDVIRNSEVAAQQIDAIQSAVKHAVGLIDDIDVLSVAQGGEARTRMVALPQLFEECRSELQAQAAIRNVELEADHEVPRVAVEGLVGTLALFNVVGNAIKYSDPAKDRRWVTVVSSLVDGQESPFVEIVVQDNGLGIPEDLQPRVFQRSFRAHPGYAEGTGLGLAITQELLIERGGRIELESRESEGTTVKILMRAIDAESVVRTAGGDRPESLMDRSVRMVLDPYEPSAPDVES